MPSGPSEAAAASREALAGAVSAITTVAILLTLGLLAYAPLGSAAVGAGIRAAFVSAVLGGLVLALFGRSAMPVAGVSSATTLMMSSLVARLAADPEADMAGAIAVASVCLPLMGLLQCAFGLLRIGTLVRYVPLPVLAGFMSGIAVLIVAAQIPLLFGLPPSSPLDLESLRAAQPATLAVALATAAVIWGVAWRRPRAPAALVGLVAGSLLYAALHVALPDLPLGPLTGFVSAEPIGGWSPLALLPGAAGALLMRHLGDLLVTALLLALIASLESTLAAAATDQECNRRHDPNRELFVYGAANLAAGLLGGLPVVLLRARAMATLQAGGRSNRAALSTALVSGLLFVACGPLIALLPICVLAAVMLRVAASLVDRWTRDLLRQFAAGDRTRDRLEGLGVVVLVCGATLSFGFVVGVAVGVLLSVALFVGSLERSLIRSRRTALQRPSRRIYAAAAEQWLHGARGRIRVLQLEGAVFFGNADRLAEEVDALEAACRTLILDLGRVTTIDASGAMMLTNLSRKLDARGVQLWLAGAAAHQRILRAFGFPPADRVNVHADLDHAVEAAEQGLLAEAGRPHSGAAVALRDCMLFDGLSAPQLERVQARCVERRLGRGGVLFRKGDPGDRLYVLTEGSISIIDPAGAERRLERRYVTLSPGMMLGETAMLDGQGRSADAVADIDSTVLELRRDDVDTLDAELVARLYRNIATHLSQRLRYTAVALAAEAD